MMYKFFWIKNGLREIKYFGTNFKFNKINLKNTHELVFDQI
jgi:hypothetical protein